MINVLIITDIGSNMDDILGFAYLRSLCDSINIVGIITSGGESKMRRMIVRAYLKLFEFPNWSKIKMYYTTNENDDDYHDVDIQIKENMYRILNTNKKSFFDLENEFNGIDYENECEFIESIQESNMTLICMGPLTPLFNASLVNKNILKKFSNVFIQGDITNCENSENAFANFKDYFQNEIKIYKFGIDTDNSYNFCGIWNARNRQLVEKSECETSISAKKVIKWLFENTDAKLFFVANSDLGITQGDLEKINFDFINKDAIRIYNKSLNTENATSNEEFVNKKLISSLSDALLIAYFDSVCVRTFIRDQIKMVLHEDLYYRIRVLRNIKYNQNLCSHLVELCKKQENIQSKGEQGKRSPWWR